MNPRWFALGALALVPLAGCSSSGEQETASPVSFAAVSSASSALPQDAQGPNANEVPRAAAGTTCGSLDVPQGTAAVVVRAGRVNCVDALRVGGVYASAAAHAEGRAVTVETSGWQCTARVTDSVATCRSGEDAFSVG
ncbi:hypothetical protein AXK57_10940 [Tsukamurella pulmonis]|uniref:hypothetical protein n=1 Tax=Tsukamurella pulmonis TaxID=47312 RepID=UPI00079532D1|nr:hypothetical protein [Tsukamurella pulmonis]KXP09406.1 hypothetical protein AXK57_10940 [Tsukamurella pulmonis]RDH12091.1 hypothetical protein DVB88_09015 [Tsukamurella pulmonis]